MQATCYHHSIKQSAKQSFKSKFWRSITLRWNKLSFSHHVEFLRACQQDLAKPSMQMSVVVPWRQETWIAPVLLYIHSIRRHRPLKWPLLPHGSALCSFFLHSGPLSTMLVTGGNCFFFPDSTSETLDSLLEGVYEILEVEFMPVMLWDLWYDIDSLIGTWERFGEFSNPVWEIKQNYSSLWFILILLDFHHF